MSNKIYFSFPVQGVSHKDPYFGPSLVNHMKKQGYKVLSEHIVAKNQKEQDNIFFQNTGINRGELSEEEKYKLTYETEMKWVDEADYFIAVVDGPSHGVGMEIMRALLKEDIGLNNTQILLLVDKKNLPTLSWTLKGVPDKYKNFQIKSYGNLKDATNTISEVLQTK